ncbi:MAG: hypothetical protein JXB39_08400 [Deltaproteobacteria bacterium]|nr:hypothetical protein [Deltaproteobacteria bacterium]
MTPCLETLLLIALPASGKSEVRRYLLHLPRERRIEAFHVADTVQLDDFPYVHFLRRTDEELVRLGQARRFYHGPNARFQVLTDWGLLLHLVNDDYAVLADPSRPSPPREAQALFERIDAARRRTDGPVVFEGMDRGLRRDLSDALGDDAGRLVDELFGQRPATLAGRTVVIEFARGGPEGATLPLSKPYGYRWNLSNLSPEILERAAVLYIWVTPEESRRKNLDRADPDDPGSSLHHSAPESVMHNDYGSCDVAWLVEHADHPDTIRIEAHGRVYHLPIARFDNRVDKTSFLRGDPGSWDEVRVRALHEALAGPMARLWAAYRAQGG